jgi:hypothetical protein
MTFRGACLRLAAGQPGSEAIAKCNQYVGQQIAGWRVAGLGTSGEPPAGTATTVSETVRSPAQHTRASPLPIEGNCDGDQQAPELAGPNPVKQRKWGASR